MNTSCGPCPPGLEPDITTAPDSFAGIAAAASKDRKKFKDVKFGGAAEGYATYSLTWRKVRRAWKAHQHG